MKKCSVTLCVLILAGAAWAGKPEKIKDQYYSFLLEENTALELPLVPDLKTRLIFPFKLDNPALDPSVKHSITPVEVFGVSQLSDQRGQNSIELWNAQSPNDVMSIIAGNGGRYAATIGLYTMSVNGYNISIRLVTSDKVEQQYENIVFNLSDEDRTHLIKMEVDQYKNDIDRQYQDKLASLDQSAKTYGVRYIADVLAVKPSVNRIKLNRVSHDRAFELFIDTVETYPNLYNTLRFEVKNRRGDDSRIESIQHIENSGADGRVFEGTDNCLGRIASGETKSCIFVTESQDLANAKKIKTTIVTSTETYEFEW